MSGRSEPDSQRRSSLRMSRSAFSAETVFVAFRFYAENRLSASVTQASTQYRRIDAVPGMSHEQRFRSVQAAYPLS